MPLVEAEPRGTLRPVPLKLDEDTRRRLLAYSKFCGSSTDRVVRVSLTRLFEEDKEYAPWLKEHPEVLEARKRMRKPKPQAEAVAPQQPKGRA